MRNFLILGILSIIIFSVSQAQENGYIINSSGDTIRGSIFDQRFRWVQFQPKGLNQYQKVSAKEIREYKYKEELYSAQYLPYVKPIVSPKEMATKQISKPSNQKYQSDPTFLRVLENGSIRLFEYMEYTGATGNTYIQQWYARKGDGPLIELKSNTGVSLSRKERKAALLAMIADNEELTNRYNEDKAFDQDRIQYFIKEYNSQAKVKNL